MGATWIVCAGEQEKSQVIHCAVPVGARTSITFVSDVWQLRAEVARRGHPFVAVGPGLAMDPFNLGAALACDGQAARVAVVASHITPEQRFWAQAVGVSDVYDLAGEAPGAPLALKEAEEEDRKLSQEPKACLKESPCDDLDEPEDAGAAPARLQEETQEATESEGAPVIVLASARGGVGKSSIAALMGVSAARWGLRVALLDFDLAFGDLYGFFGHPAPVDLMDVIRLGTTSDPGRLSLVGSGVEVAESLTLYGPCAAPEYAELAAPHALQLVAAAKRAFDLVIVDTSPVWADAVAQAVQVADRVAIVGDERAGAIGSLARAAKLAVRLGVARTRIVRLMNRCDPRCRDEEFMTRASLGLETTSSFRVLEGTVDVSELLSSGHAVELTELDNEFSNSCAATLAKLLAEMGRLPDHPEARKARDARVVRRRSVFSFAKAAG